MQDKVCHFVPVPSLGNISEAAYQSLIKLKTKNNYKICNHTGLNPTKAHIIILIMAFFGHFDLGNQNN